MCFLFLIAVTVVLGIRLFHIVHVHLFRRTLLVLFVLIRVLGLLSSWTPAGTSMSSQDSRGPNALLCASIRLPRPSRRLPLRPRSGLALRLLFLLPVPSAKLSNLNDDQTTLTFTMAWPFCANHATVSSGRNARATTRFCSSGSCGATNTSPGILTLPG
jgi:hypothetical protein